MAIDWTDPCARAAELSKSYYQLVSGGSVASIKVKAAGGEREVRFHKSELSSLRLEMQRAEDACRALNNLPPLRRRFAIQVGARRPC